MQFDLPYTMRRLASLEEDVKEQRQRARRASAGDGLSRAGQNIMLLQPKMTYESKNRLYNQEMLEQQSARSFNRLQLGNPQNQVLEDAGHKNYIRPDTNRMQHSFLTGHQFSESRFNRSNRATYEPKVENYNPTIIEKPVQVEVKKRTIDPNDPYVTTNQRMQNQDFSTIPQPYQLGNSPERANIQGVVWSGELHSTRQNFNKPINRLNSNWRNRDQGTGLNIFRRL